MHISIILVNYNSDKLTIACLDSLAEIKHTGFKHNIVVVDNASKVPFRLPKRHQNKVVRLVRSESNLGFTGGNNMGIHYSIENFNSEYVVLLNNDTTVDKNFLVELFNYAEAHPKVGIATSKIYFSKGREYYLKSYNKDQLGKVIWFAGGSIDWQNLLAFHRGVDEVDRGQFSRDDSFDFATGCAMMIKREVLEKVGTLDKRYFLYMEDVDYSVRVKKAGYDLRLVPSSVVWHKNAGSTGGSGSHLQQYYQARNTLLFVILHGDYKQAKVFLRLFFNSIFKGNKWTRLAVLHLLTLRFGKQEVV